MKYVWMALCTFQFFAFYNTLILSIKESNGEYKYLNKNNFDIKEIQKFFIKNHKAFLKIS